MDRSLVKRLSSHPTRVLYFYSSTHMDTGSPRALLAMVDSLDRAEFEPVFLALTEGPLCDELRLRNVAVLRGQSDCVDLRRPLASLARVRALRRLLREHRIGIVHLNELGWNSELAIAARWAGCPLVLHFHNPGDVAAKNLNWRLASHVILVSEQQKQTITNFDRIRKKATVVHNAIDLDEFGKGRAIRASLGLPADAIIVGTVAQIGRRKGFDFLLETARRVVAEEPRVVFIVAGPDHAGEEDFAVAMRQQAALQPLDDHVVFLGTRKDVPDLLASIDVFFLPTRAEPFGLVIIEAMAGGVPVVASRVGGIPEIIRTDAEGLLVEAGDCADYARALLSLARDETLRRRVGDAGRASLPGRFDNAALGARLARIYRSSTRMSA